MNKNIQISGIFFCDINPEDFRKNTAPLFPGQMQHWLAIIDSGLMQETEGKTAPEYMARFNRMSPEGKKQSITALSKEFLLHYVKALGGVFETDVALNLSATRGNVSCIRGISVSQNAHIKGTEKTYNDLIPKPAIILRAPLGGEIDNRALFLEFVFLYEGRREKTIWPWIGRGVLRACPEDLQEGLVAVYSPAVVPNECTDDSIWPENPLSEVSSAFKLVLWGSAAVVLYNVAKGAATSRNKIINKI